MDTVRAELVATLRATRETIAVNAANLRPFGPGASQHYDTLLARIDANLKAEDLRAAAPGSRGGWDGPGPTPGGVKVYI